MLRDGDADHNDVLSQLLVPEGNKLFQDARQSANKWQLQ